MSKSIVSAVDVVFRVPYKHRSLFAQIADSIPLGNREDILRGDGYFQVKFNNFSVNKGQCSSIFGVDGLALSALMQMISGDIKPLSGILKVKGTVTSTQKLRAKLPDNNSLFELLSNDLFSNSQEPIITKHNIERILIFSELLSVANVKGYQLSEVEKVRLVSSVALRSESDLVLLDPLLFSCHKEFINKVLDRIALLKLKGTSFLIAASSPDNIFGISDTSIKYIVT